MKKPINLSDLLGQFELISQEEGRSILGGTDLEVLFAQIFDFSASNLTPAAIAMFKKQITDLASTAIGATMLDALIDKGNKIYIDNDAPHSSSGALAEYEGSANKLHIGAMDTDMSVNYNNALAYALIAHELYHAYQDNVLYSNVTSPAYLAYAKDVKSELDAGLFSYMATVQYDINHNLSRDDNNSHSRMSFALPGNYNSQQGINFNDTWDDMFQNGNFSLENYNKLIENWKEGSSYKIGKETYNSLGSFDNTWIDNLFSTMFKGDVKLFKAMMEDTDMTPNQLIQRDPMLHGAIDNPTPGPGGPSDGGSPDGGSSPSYNNDNSGGGSDSGYSPTYSNGGFYYGAPDPYTGGGSDYYGDRTGYRGQIYSSYDGSSSY